MIRLSLRLLLLVIVSGLLCPVASGAAGAAGERSKTVKAGRDMSLNELIESAGYTLQDRDVEPFLREFSHLNRDLKSLRIIRKGTAVVLPVKRLVPREAKGRVSAAERPARRKTAVDVRPEEGADLVLKSLSMLAYALADVRSVKFGGTKTFSLSEASDFSLDTASFPLIELADNTVLVLDYRGTLPRELQEVIEVIWPEYRIISSGGDLRSSVSVLLAAIGYETYREGRLVFGGRTKIEMSPDFVVVRSGAESMAGEVVVVSVIGPAEYRIPEPLKEFARERGIRILELFQREPALEKRVSPLVRLDAEGLQPLSEEALSLLGYAFRKGEAVSLSEGKGFALSFRPDISLSVQGRTKVVQFSETPDQVRRYLGKHSYDLLTVSLRTKRFEVVKKMLAFLSADVTEKTEALSAALTPKKAKYRLSAPGALVKTAGGRLFFMDSATDAAVVAPLVEEGITVVTVRN